MNDFQRELQMLNVGDFQATQAVPWDQNQYYTDQDRQFINFGFGQCFRCFSCFSCFFCFNCFSCFRCSNCSRCSRCGGGHRCGGGGRCGG
ncbi:heterocycloanthracin/sonorensin family bacteriocin [Peribacillus alkalitolerans]|uniref:heterocycloanthracin/sonorensin family bacteriocin n=1 Tax=Peribacillus alkalitolerans TaxID=1550385 RepID=UPI0013D7F2E4|nr:heterocycloanthracin/sonorensin family bacteriocin [Peribacillus alkalitolerans]